MSRRLGVVLIALSFAAVSTAARQMGMPAPDPARPIVIGHSETVASAILKQAVPVDVYVPRDYATGETRYPVLVAFMTRLPAVAGIVDGLADHTIPPMIAVSVNLNPSMYSLEPNTRQPGSGQAAAILRFLQEELAPWVDARYRTRPFRVAFGSSSSAIFCIYALFSAPDLFHSAIAAGPMFAETDYGRVSDLFVAALARRAPKPARLFFTQGDQPELTSDLRSFEGLLQRNAAAGRDWLRWEFNPEPGENHGSLALKTLHDGLRTLFADWAQLPERMADEGADRIRAYRKRLAASFGYDIGLGRGAYAAVRAKLTREQRFDALAEILASACEDNPHDYVGYVSLALAYEQGGRFKESAAAYETAITKARATLPNDVAAQVVPRLEAARQQVRARQ